MLGNFQIQCLRSHLKATSTYVYVLRVYFNLVLNKQFVWTCVHCVHGTEKKYSSKLILILYIHVKQCAPQHSTYISLFLPASSKECCLNPKGWCPGTPYHPFSTPWKIQVSIFQKCVHLRSQFSKHITPALGSWLPPKKILREFFHPDSKSSPVFTLRNSASPSPMAPFLRQLLNELLKTASTETSLQGKTYKKLLVGSWEMKVIKPVPFFWDTIILQVRAVSFRVGM